MLLIAPFWFKKKSTEIEHGPNKHTYMFWNRWGKNGNSDRLYFGGLQNQCRQWLHDESKRHLLLGRKAMTNLDSVLKKQRYHFADKRLYSQSCGFPIVTNGCESWTIKGWTLKNWCFQTMVLEKTLQSPLDCKEIKPVNPKGNQPWIFIERTVAEAEASILWPPDAKSQFTRKDPHAGKDWGQEEKGTTEDEMVR